MANHSRTETVIGLLASHIDAYHRCISRHKAHGPTCEGSTELDAANNHTEAIESLAKQILPSGSGIDSGTTVDIDASTGDRIVLTTSFHHMNDGGMYDGWTEHTITVTPSFIGGMNVKIGGRNRNDIKDYLGDTFSYTLASTVVQEWDAERERWIYRESRTAETV